MKIGYLPLYIKLYDDGGTNRDVMETFYHETADIFESKGFEVERADFCRIKEEFKAAISHFENAGVDAIVTWHAAYSPSLESIDALTETDLPIIVFDSTPTLEFGMQQDPSEIGANHGIHGVMDMCSMLKRHGKAYAIAAGHCENSNVIDKVCGFVRAAVVAKKLSGMKVGLVGGSFEGMGDFLIPPSEMKERFGISVETIEAEKLAKLKESITSEEVEKEIAEDKLLYDFNDDVVPSEYSEFTHYCLTLRKCIEQEKYGAFSVNFLNAEVLGTMPFMECCKAMERGIGYAGEGDALTAAFTGALLSAYPDTSFVEIFCPDWKNNMVFLSHMGEMNYRIADGKPCVSRVKTSLVKGAKPYAGYSRMKAGKGVYVNISRDKDDFQLLLADAEILSAENDSFKGSMRGWMRSSCSSTEEFLKALSVNGATHHSTFVYGASAEELEYFGRLLSLKTIIV